MKERLGERIRRKRAEHKLGLQRGFTQRYRCTKLVYFEAGDSTPDVAVVTDQSYAGYDPPTLEADTDYYWQIVAVTDSGRRLDGPVWSFQTEPVLDPPPVDVRLVLVEAPVAPRRDEASLGQRLQVERQRGTRQGEPRGDLARRVALGPAPNQQAEHRQPRVLRQRRQRRDGILVVHGSKDIKMNVAGG